MCRLNRYQGSLKTTSAVPQQSVFRKRRKGGGWCTTGEMWPSAAKRWALARGHGGRSSRSHSQGASVTWQSHHQPSPIKVNPMHFLKGGEKKKRVGNHFYDFCDMVEETLKEGENWAELTGNRSVSYKTR